MDLAGLKPCIYFNNSPSGTFTLTIYNNMTPIKAYTFTDAQVKASIDTTDGYMWVYVALPGRCTLLPGSYTLELTSSGYTYAYNNFIGWIKNFDKLPDKVYGTLPNDFSDYPYEFKLCEYANRELI